MLSVWQSASPAIGEMDMFHSGHSKRNGQQRCCSARESRVQTSQTQPDPDPDNDVYSNPRPRLTLAPAPTVTAEIDDSIQS